MYNLQPDKIPAVNPRQGYQTNAPDDFRTYNGFEIGTNLKLPQERVRDGQPDDRQDAHPRLHGRTIPNSLRFCDRTTPFRHIFKFSGSVPLPVRDHVSGELPDLRHAGVGSLPRGAVLRGEPDGDFDRRSGAPSPAARMRPAARTTVNLLAPNTIFADYYKIFDMRVLEDDDASGRQRITALAEFDNLFNMRNVVAVTENYGDELAASGVGPARPQHPVRDSVPILRTQRRLRTQRSAEAQRLVRWLRDPGPAGRSGATGTAGWAAWAGGTVPAAPRRLRPCRAEEPVLIRGEASA